jgi:PAS domain S-box-containing protein
MKVMDQESRAGPPPADNTSTGAVTEGSLKGKEETIRALLNARSDSALLLDVRGTILAANDTVARRLSVSVESLQGRCIYDFFDGEHAGGRRERIAEVFRTVKPIRFDDERNGVWYDNNIVPVFNESGVVERVAVFATDITERKRAEEAVLASERKYRTLVTAMREGIMAVDAVDIIQLVNPRMCEMLGYEDAELVGRPVAAFLADDCSQTLLKEKRELRAIGVSDTYELAMRRKNGRVIQVLITGNPVVDEGGRITGSMAVMTDITERKRASDQLRAAFQEKVVLLKEIHHRVKNNLQVISSLLNLQSGHITDPTVRELFKESQNRIRSMALVHEKLYRSSDLFRIDCSEYMQSLAGNLFRSYGGDARGITMRVETNGVSVGIDEAIPCGLIVNELLSNALKYAFPGEDVQRSFSPDGPEITLALADTGTGKLRLSVRDNGIGFPQSVDFRSTSSLGMQLVNVLAEQLGGSVELEPGPGTTFALTFPAA